MTAHTSESSDLLARNDQGETEMTKETQLAAYDVVDHPFTSGGYDSTFGAAGTWCAAPVERGGEPDQCGLPPQTHRNPALYDEVKRLRAELDEAMSILARIGDAISPTGERPEEALGTLARDVQSLVDQLADATTGRD